MAVENRARLTVKGTGYDLPFNGPASILKLKRGIIFPYTPAITQSYTTEYTSYDLVHTNYGIQSFVRHRPGNISISANFIHQTREEALYTIGVLHFLKVVSKMHFGQDDEDRGTPPPLLEFSAYGITNFEKVPVFVTAFSMSYPEDVDYVKVNLNIGSNSNTIELPVTTTITVELLPHYPASIQESDFNMNNFSRGDLYTKGFI